MKKFSLKKKWMAPAVYTATGLLIGSTLMTTTTAFASTGNFKSFWGKMFQDGQYVQSAQAVQYNGTNFFGIWYLNKLLAQDGIQANWDGQNLTLSNVPVQQTSQLSVSTSTSSTSSSNPVVSNSIVVNGVTYVPLNTVQSLLQNAGIQAHLNEKSDDKQGSEDNQGDQQDSQDDHGDSAAVIDLQASVAHIQNAVKELSGKDGDKGDDKDNTSSQGFTNVKQYANAIGQIQQAYGELTQDAATLQAQGSTTLSGSLNSSQSTNSAGSSGTSTSSTTATTYADVATQLQSIASSLQTDWNNINQLALASLSGASQTSSSTNSSTSTSSSTTTSTSTNTSTSAPTVGDIVADLNTQANQLQTLGSQISGQAQGSDASDGSDKNSDSNSNRND